MILYKYILCGYETGLNTKAFVPTLSGYLYVSMPKSILRIFNLFMCIFFRIFSEYGLNCIHIFEREK